MKTQFAFIAIACALLLGCESTTNTKPSSTATPAKPSTPATASNSTSNPSTPITTNKPTTDGSLDADNTGVNKRDRDRNAKTPIDQDENRSDVDRTAAVRKRILEIKDLSIDGRNVKIITAKGKVTLRGPVASDAERDEIVKIAKELCGEDNVDNQLEVAPKK
jgi:hyperosmotically inducible protein